MTADSSERILNIAAYRFVGLDDLDRRRRELKLLTQKLATRGTILLSSEGINLFVAGSESACRELIGFLRSEPATADLVVKESWTSYQPFHRMLVKIKKEIIAFGVDAVQPAQHTSPKLSPMQLKAWLDEKKPIVLLDTRNDYEVELGTFADAIDLNIKHFRDFPKAVESLPQSMQDRPIVMFCTGGIRCEKAGPMLEHAGFREVYQLDGGILNYFHECGGEHYRGDCFVFDQRVAVTPSLQPSGAAPCFACQGTLTPIDLASPKYVIGVSCPRCYQTEQQILFTQRQQRQDQLDSLAASMPGSTPYENRRVMYVPRRGGGMTSAEYLSTVHLGLSRSYWERELQLGNVVQGEQLASADQIVTADQILKEGERLIHIEYDYVEPNIDGAIRIIHDDDALVVISKPAGLPSHASGRFNRNTVDYLLNKVYGPDRVHLVHRLDAMTSGIMVLARRHRFVAKLQNQFAQRTVDKYYLARVIGFPEVDEFICDAAITDFPGLSGRRRAIDGNVIDESTGLNRHAITQFNVLERLVDGTSLVIAKPITGRTNQIRIHLAHLGFPICNDTIYGDEADFEDNISRESRAVNLSKLMLFAWKIALDHPISKERVTYSAALPEWSSSQSWRISRALET